MILSSFLRLPVQVGGGGVGAESNEARVRARHVPALIRNSSHGPEQNLLSTRLSSCSAAFTLLHTGVSDDTATDDLSKADCTVTKWVI